VRTLDNEFSKIPACFELRGSPWANGKVLNCSRRPNRHCPAYQRLQLSGDTETENRSINFLTHQAPPLHACVTKDKCTCANGFRTRAARPRARARIRFIHAMFLPTWGFRQRRDVRCPRPVVCSLHWPIAALQQFANVLGQDASAEKLKLDERGRSTGMPRNCLASRFQLLPGWNGNMRRTARDSVWRACFGRIFSACS